MVEKSQNAITTLRDLVVRALKPERYRQFSTGVEGLVWREKFNPYHTEVKPHELYINKIENDGIRPLTMGEIMDYLGSDVKKMVLFDTVPSLCQPGNHWRVLNVDTNTQEVELQFCGGFGYIDLGVEAFKLPIEVPFFTGVSIQKYVHKELGELTLSEVTNLYKNTKDRASLPIVQSFKNYWVEGSKIIGDFRIPHKK
jgi:hypothetical protein